MQALTLHDIKTLAPAALAEEPSTRVSSTYSFLPTRAVADALATEGWVITEARQASNRLRNPAHAKHQVAFTHRDVLAKHLDEVPRIYLSNSHDGGAAAVEFARLAILLRFPGDSEGVVAMEDVLAPRRPQDAGNDLWRVFNRAQEAILKGGFPIYHHTPTGWVPRTGRAVKAIDESTRLNTGLWSLAEQFSKN